jgi:glycerophosphoryl diester phosphodiesterase
LHLKKILNIAHRGASTYAPENTIESIQMAVELGADMVEFDLRRSSDGVIVLWHDERVDFGDGKAVRVSDISIGDLNMVAHGMGFKPACFDEILRQFGSRIGFDIEIKIGGFEQEIVDLLAKFPPLFPPMVSSFHPGIIAKIKRLNASLNTALVVGNNRMYKLGYPSRKLLRRIALNSGAGSIHLNLNIASRPLLNELTALGLDLYIWTVNDESEMHSLIGMGIDGIISDKPDLVKRVIQSYLNTKPEFSGSKWPDNFRGTVGI